MTRSGPSGAAVTAWVRTKACAFLESRGYVLSSEFEWKIPDGHAVTDDELEAGAFLVDEWDFGGFYRTERDGTVAHVFDSIKHVYDQIEVDPSAFARLSAALPRASWWRRLWAWLDRMANK